MGSDDEKGLCIAVKMHPVISACPNPACLVSCLSLPTHHCDDARSLDNLYLCRPCSAYDTYHRLVRRHGFELDSYPFLSPRPSGPCALQVQS